MNVAEFLENTQGEATQEYELVIEQPGATAGKPRLWRVEDVHRDTSNKRVVMRCSEVIEE